MALWLAVLCLLLLMGGGCGKKGDPLPPGKPKPQDAVTQRGLLPS